MKLSELKNKKIAILGFGKEWKSNLEFLRKIWVKDITILDKNTEIKKEDSLKYNLWENYLDNLWGFDLIFKTPWISPYHEKIIPYRHKLISWAQVFFDNYEWRVIGITWTKGKSTTTTLIYKALEIYWYNVKIVWNIGNPILDEIDIISWEKYDYIVYELSSYMLEDLTPKCFISILLNIYPDHLDWHSNFENYKKAKLNIIEGSINPLINSGFLDLINIEYVKTFWSAWDYLYKWHNFYIDWKKIFDDKKILLKWEHNRLNISAVIWVLDIVWIKDYSKFESILKTFCWLPHRLEDVWIYAWIRFIDDAISTTPESTIEAIKTFWDEINTIFLWGTDRWYDFKELAKYLKKYEIKNIVLFPDSWDKILNLITPPPTETPLEKGRLQGNFNILQTKRMKEAVDFAFKHTEKGKICLLSTASPSYSLWKNFEEKWNEFKKEIQSYH